LEIVFNLLANLPNQASPQDQEIDLMGIDLVAEKHFSDLSKTDQEVCKYILFSYLFLVLFLTEILFLFFLVFL
jgi:hypothetical protein